MLYIAKENIYINTSVNESFSKKIAGRSSSCSILLEDSEEIRQVLQATKFMDGEGRLYDLREPVSALIVKNACCQRAFLRGAFLAAGSMSDPEKSYHLEIVCTNSAQAEQICSILLLFQVEARIVQRKKYQIVYMKDGAGISDFLNIVEAMCP